MYKEYLVQFSVLLSGDDTILEKACSNEESETQKNCSLIFKGELYFFLDPVNK